MAQDVLPFWMEVHIGVPVYAHVKRNFMHQPLNRYWWSNAESVHKCTHLVFWLLTLHSSMQLRDYIPMHLHLRHCERVQWHFATMTIVVAYHEKTRGPYSLAECGLEWTTDARRRRYVVNVFLLCIWDSLSAEVLIPCFPCDNHQAAALNWCGPSKCIVFHLYCCHQFMWSLSVPQLAWIMPMHFSLALLLTDMEHVALIKTWCGCFCPIATGYSKIPPSLFRHCCTRTNV